MPQSSKDDLTVAVSTNSFTQGKYTENLENSISETFNLPAVVLCNSGTSALMIALLEAGIGIGDEVIVPAMTWIATAQAVELIGAKAIIVDIDIADFCISIDAVENAITSRTKAIIPVFFNGRRPNSKSLALIAAKYGIKVIEDRCKAMGTTFFEQSFPKEISAQAYSLGMISYISVGYGGFVAFKDPESAEKARQIRDHGMQRRPEKYLWLGGNFKVSDVLASLGLAQVPLVKERIQNYFALQEVYASEFKKQNRFSLQTFSKWEESVGTYLEILLDEHVVIENFVDRCMDEGVQVTPYHARIDRAHYLMAKDCANARALESRLIAIPSGPGVSTDLAREAAKRICVAASKL